MPTRSYARILFLLGWLVLAAAGLVGMARYEQTAGDIGKTPLRWPAKSGIALDPSRPTLVMFAHPKCPCTRASMEELNRLLAQSHGEVSPHVLFFAPENSSSDWTESSLWSSAKAIPGVVAETDSAGAKARLFGAETSGYVVVYNPSGELLFHGGITAGRGHAGDNSGVRAILSLLSTHEAPTRQTRVFGCALLDAKKSPGSPVSVCTRY